MLIVLIRPFDRRSGNQPRQDRQASSLPGDHYAVTLKRQQREIAEGGPAVKSVRWTLSGLDVPEVHVDPAGIRVPRGSCDQ